MAADRQQNQEVNKEVKHISMVTQDFVCAVVLLALLIVTSFVLLFVLVTLLISGKIGHQLDNKMVCQGKFVPVLATNYLSL